MQKAPDVVEAVECPIVHVRRIHLGARRPGIRQRNGLIAEMSEPSSGMSQARAGQPKQRAAGHSPHSDLHAPVLDELPIVVVQGAPDQNARRRGLMRLVPERPLQRPDHDVMGQGRRVVRLSRPPVLSSRVEFPQVSI